MTVPHSTSLYVPRGRGIIYVAEWTGQTPPTLPTEIPGTLNDYVDVGNATQFEVEPVSERSPHYTSREGVNLKDLNPVTTLEYTIGFTLDEMAAANLNMFLMGTLNATTRVIAGLQGVDKEYAIIFISNNPIGPNSKAYFWKVTIAPNGAIALIGDEYLNTAFTAEGLADTANHAASPYFDYHMATTTTTTSTTTTSSTTSTTSTTS